LTGGKAYFVQQPIEWRANSVIRGFYEAYVSIHSTADFLYFCQFFFYLLQLFHDELLLLRPEVGKPWRFGTMRHLLLIRFYFYLFNL